MSQYAGQAVALVLAGMTLSVYVVGNGHHCLAMLGKGSSQVSSITMYYFQSKEGSLP